MSSTKYVFLPDDGDWTSLERSIGRSIAQPLREKISNIVQQHFAHQPFETNAPFLDDVLSRLLQIKEAANIFRKELQGPRNRADRETSNIVRATLARFLDIPGYEAEVETVELLEEFVGSVMSAADEARKHFVAESSDGFVEGQSWQRMVSRLKTLMRDSSMPHGASQASDKSKTNLGSPFVRFVQTLQRSFPNDALRRHQRANPFALAKEINRADRAFRMKNGT